MRTQWFVYEVQIEEKPAWIAAYKVNSFKNVLRHNLRTCGGFSRNRESVEELVCALNKREKEHGKKCEKHPLYEKEQSGLSKSVRSDVQDLTGGRNRYRKH